MVDQDDRGDATASTEPLAEGRLEVVPLGVLIVDAPDGQRTIALEAAVVAGSSPDANLYLSGRGISRQHARFSARDGVYLVEDLGSRNGTFVNETRIERAVLRPGDRIKLGTCTLRFDSAARRIPVSPSQAECFGSLYGRSLPMRRLYGLLERIAPAECTVLIRGETGTGKEEVARSIHERSPRAKGPFIALDCSVLSPDVLASELFGHMKGAFSGADRNHGGVFQDARGGTVFLDEIGDLPPAVQAAFLRVLENREVRPVGASRPVSVDVRVVAATHRDLREMVKRREFREDLFFRLSVMTVQTPPLRDRLDDIPVLVAKLLERAGADARLTAAAMDELQRGSWPGNVRELRNTLQRALVLSAGAPIDAEHVASDPEASSTPSPDPGGLAGSLEGMELRAIRAAVEEAGGNLSRAARALGIHRDTLRRKLARSSDPGA